MNTYIPEGYKSLLGVYDTQKAIGLLKRLFEDQLAANLNLFRVSAPLFLEESSGLNDNLNGYERPVSFDILQTGREAQVVQSLAKWKRMALYRYDFYPGKGLYTDMNAIRRDEDVLDNLHSVYVDQWDWEKVIERRDRNLDYLKSTVMDIVAAVCETQRTMRAIYPQLQVLPELERQVTFITAQELEDRYPNLTPKEREHAFVREHHTTFIIGIGGALRSGKPHDGRSPDYDDWTMNGDILFWNELLDCAFELSSMGIRVDPESLDRQLTISGCDDRRKLTYHKMLLAGELPLTIRVLDGFYLLLLPASTHTRDSVVGRCRQALTDFVTHFPFSINFFVFQKICLPESLLDAFLALKQFAAKNVTYENHVFDLAQETRTAVPASSQPIPSDRWSDLLLAGKTEQLQIEVFAFLNQLKSSGTATREFLTGFYYQFLQLLFRQMDHPGSEDEAFRRQITVASPEQTFSSFGALREWISNSLLLFTQSRQAAASQDTAVATVKAYIESHLSDELDRDTLAAMVYLNADYLSHLFKKDTGSSLINYIIDRRIAHSKELLAKGEMSIRDIAITCGFQNISYFSRQFKKSTGMTPRQFKN